MEKAVVTGALQIAGFHLCMRLLDEGMAVVGIDRMERCDKIKEEMLLSVGRNANFQHAESLKDEHLRDAHLLFHLDEDPLSETEFKRRIALCDEFQIPIVYLSSLDVYGNSSTCCTEGSKLEPATPLGKRKKQEELALRSNLEEKNRRILIFRTPRIYGPWQPANDDMQRIFQLANNQAALKGDEQLMNRDFVNQYMFVEDVVDAIMLAGEREFHCEIYNLSSDEQKFSSKKARERLSFRPKHTFDEGIEKLKQHILKASSVNRSLFENEK